MGTASNNAGAAADMVFAEAVKPYQYCFPFILKIPIQISDTRIKIAPGENRNCAELEISVSKRLGKDRVALSPVNADFTAGTLRVMNNRMSNNTAREKTRKTQKRGGWVSSPTVNMPHHHRGPTGLSVE